RLTALLPSIALARDELRHQGPTLDEKTIHRMTRQLGAEVLATRTRDLHRFRDGQLPAGREMAGQHVVAQVDGGRVRIRTQVETKKRKGVKHRRKIRVEWREPKLLILYLSDRKGRMLRGTRPWIDGTMNGPDHLMELLAFHLHRLGAARAKAGSFVSDGAPWIWNRLGWGGGRPEADGAGLGLVARGASYQPGSAGAELVGGGADGDVPNLAPPTASGPESRRGGDPADDGRGSAPGFGCMDRDRVPEQARGAPAVRLVRLPGSSSGQRRGRERDPSGDQLAAEGQRDLLEGGECRGDAGAARGGADGSVAGDDGTGAGGDGAGPSPRLAVGGTRH